jgi:hypothetical protein
MPVTVKTGQSKKQTETVVRIADLTDYEVEGARSDGMKAFWIWALFMFLFGLFFTYFDGTRGIGIGIFVWWFVAAVVYFIIWPRMLQRRLRLEGPEIVVTAQNAPRLKTTLSKGSALLGIEPPEAYLLNENVPQVRIAGVTRPYYLVLTRAALDLLQPAELDCLVIRRLVQIRQGQVRRLSVLRQLNDTMPALRILAWPVLFYGFLLRHWWQDPAEQTADRLTLLLVKNHKLIMSAVIKLHAASDPLMLEENITPADVDSYVRIGDEIGLEGDEISTHYKLGQAIHENLYLESRLHALDEWAQSREYKEAIERLNEARAAKGAPAAATS